MSTDDEKALADLDKSFNLISTDPLSEALYGKLKQQDQQWKKLDPVGYKKDLEKMCKDMCGDNWEAEYQALLREEFPEEY